MAADPLALALRCLPALLVFILAFIAASDRRTRAQWSQLMYQVGSIRADQRDDPKVQSGVKWPFFLVALLLLIWPVQFYRKAARVLVPVETSSGVARPSEPPVAANGVAPAANSVTPETAPPTGRGEQPVPLQR